MQLLMPLSRNLREDRFDALRAQGMKRRESQKQASGEQKAREQGKRAGADQTVTQATGTQAAFLRPARNAGVFLHIHAKPGAKQSHIGSVDPAATALDVLINAPAREGAANEELCSFIAEVLDLKARNVTIQAGHKAREKVLLLQTVMTEEQVLGKLLEYINTDEKP